MSRVSTLSIVLAVFFCLLSAVAAPLGGGSHIRAGGHHGSTSSSVAVGGSSKASETAPAKKPSSTGTSSSGAGVGVGVGVGLSANGNGKLSFFDTGLGSCGNTNKPSDFIVAMPAGLMSSSLCGKTVTISANGKTTTATVADTCPGCDDTQLDCTTSLFDFFADPSVGIVTGVTWSVAN
ncbi:hypothetical protein BOTBODRAFT_26998 [Botryobasidium botryosum FD-172 SS1]|uniref:RlpA-like protein double-psi beta-barrel domain-containing protein n=1 Tax=Botryobasidium botryosum (strain FD-172 SS1) TaxID=930990 RepID=A0A067MZ07_BOTB1|nr:hypothetical protein BOTBODRAFT_26998 [Botryobasidium botryosum FD-172 SS1]